MSQRLELNPIIIIVLESLCLFNLYITKITNLISLLFRLGKSSLIENGHQLFHSVLLMWLKISDGLLQKMNIYKIYTIKIDKYKMF